MGQGIPIAGWRLTGTAELIAASQVQAPNPRPRGLDFEQQLLPVVWILGAAVLVLAAYGARRRLLKALARWWVIADELDPSGAVVVLPGDAPRLDCLRRAIELKITKWVPFIVLVNSESSLAPSLDGSAEQDAFKQGLPPGGLLVTHQKNPFSVTSFLYIRELLFQLHVSDIILVTPSIHTRRAHVLAGTLWIPRGIRVLFCPVADPDFRTAAWWETSAGRATMFKEVAKVASTWWQLRRLRAEAFHLPAGLDGRITR